MDVKSVFATYRDPQQSTDAVGMAALGHSSLKRGLYKTVKSRIRRLLPNSIVQIRDYRKNHGVFPNIIRPLTFNEKLLHRNLFDRRPLLREMADKAAARLYVEARLGPQILPKLYSLTTRPETLPFDKLPDRFVVKPTHFSGLVRLVSDKSALDRAALITLCQDWLRRDYYDEAREWVYKNIQPQILVEEFIDDGSGVAPIDYKLFVFDGTVRLIQVHTGRFRDHRLAYYTPDWKKLEARVGDYAQIIDEVQPPQHLAEMIAAAETLGQGLDFVRADFYDTRDQIYFGELTMLPGGGCDRYYPEEFDRYLGGFWTYSQSLLARSLTQKAMARANEPLWIGGRKQTGL